MAQLIEAMRAMRAGLRNTVYEIRAGALGLSPPARLNRPQPGALDTEP